MATTRREVQPFQWHYTELDEHNLEVRGRALFYSVVFAILFFVTLFFYSRWLRRLTSPSLPNAPPSLSQGLDPTTINTLPIIMHRLTSTPNLNRVGDQGNECCICLGEFEDGDRLKILPKCRHFYHGECVDRWLSTSRVVHFVEILSGSTQLSLPSSHSKHKREGNENKNGNIINPSQGRSFFFFGNNVF